MYKIMVGSSTMHAKTVAVNFDGQLKIICFQFAFALLPLDQMLFSVSINEDEYFELFRNDVPDCL